MPPNLYLGPMASWPTLAPHARRVTVANGQQLFIYEAGQTSAPAMVLIHGLGDEADSWRHVFGPLAERYHVVALDLPGFGRSDPARAYTLPTFRDTLIALLDALQITTATLVGNSLGAMLAQLVALQAPQRVSRLILVDGTLNLRPQSINPATLMMALPLIGYSIYTNFRKNAQAAYDSLRPFYADLDALPEADRQFLFQRVNERVWSDKQRTAYLAVFRNLTFAPGRSRPTEAAIRALPMPIHLIWGERDVIIPVAAAHALVALKPDARLTVISGGGHLPHQDQPAATLAAILA